MTKSLEYCWKEWGVSKPGGGEMFDIFDKIIGTILAASAAAISVAAVIIAVKFATLVI